MCYLAPTEIQETAGKLENNRCSFLSATCLLQEETRQSGLKRYGEL